MKRNMTFITILVLLMGLALFQPAQPALAGCPAITLTITNLDITPSQATVTYDLTGAGTYNVIFTALDQSSGFTATVGTGTDTGVSATTGRVFSFALNPAQVADGETIRVVLDTPCAKTSADATAVGPSSAVSGTCDDGRINYLHCDKIAMYAVADDGSFALDVLIVDHLVVPRGAVFVSAADLDALPAKPETNTLIAVSPDGLVVFYKLSSGEYQVNYGPDEDNKVFVFRWRGLPAAAYPKVFVYVSRG
ncbi:MAG: hypothetical protein R3E39_29360 [Anaerolineae bacterium]